MEHNPPRKMSYQGEGQLTLTSRETLAAFLVSGVRREEKQGARVGRKGKRGLLEYQYPTVSVLC